MYFEIYEKGRATLIQFPVLASLNCLWHITLRLRDLRTATNPVYDTEKKSCKSSSQGVVVQEVTVLSGSRTALMAKRGKEGCSCVFPRHFFIFFIILCLPGVQSRRNGSSNSAVNHRLLDTVRMCLRSYPFPSFTFLTQCPHYVSFPFELQSNSRPCGL